MVAVSWLKGETLGSLPRSVVDGVTPIDRFDVKVINHSGGFQVGRSWRRQLTV